MGSAALDDVARRTMTSLRFRLLGCVVLALILSLGFGGAIACWNASRLAQTEMRTVLALGEQKVRHALGDLSRSDNRRQYLEHLITAFNGDRYLRATLLRVGDDSGRSRELIATSTLDEPLYRVPEWFLQLLGLTPETMRIPIAIDNLQGFVALETDPSNEAQEIWTRVEHETCEFNNEEQRLNWLLDAASLLSRAVAVERSLAHAE